MASSWPDLRPPLPIHSFRMPWPRRLLHWMTILPLLLLLLSPPSECLPFSPISPRFLHFSVQIRPEWLVDTGKKVLAIFESAEEGPGSWQLAVQLFANHPQEAVPFSVLGNVTRGWKPVRVEGMEECALEGTRSIRLEVELSPQFLYVRAKNAAKYTLPQRLHASADLRVFFVRVEHPEGVQGPTEICQLSSELNLKETSRFALPSTTPHPPPMAPTTVESTSTSTTTPSTTTITRTTTTSTTINESRTTSTNSIIIEEEIVQKEQLHVKEQEQQQKQQLMSTITPQKLPLEGGELEQKKDTQQYPLYKRKRVKVPRRSTMAAQRFLGPNHYVPQQDWARGRQQQQQRMFPPMPTRSTPGWPYGGYGGGEPVITTTVANYIDIIRDRQLYEEVQRSRTMEINSRWSLTFVLFMGLVAVLISLSSAFALVMFVLLQCRPKPNKQFVQC